MHSAKYRGLDRHGAPPSYWLDWRQIKPARTARKDAARRSAIRPAGAVPSCLVALFLSGSKAMIRSTVGMVSVDFRRCEAAGFAVPCYFPGLWIYSLFRRIISLFSV